MIYNPAPFNKEDYVVCKKIINFFKENNHMLSYRFSNNEMIKLLNKIKDITNIDKDNYKQYFLQYIIHANTRYNPQTYTLVRDTFIKTNYGKTNILTSQGVDFLIENKAAILQRIRDFENKYVIAKKKYVEEQFVCHIFKVNPNDIDNNDIDYDVYPSITYPEDIKSDLSTIMQACKVDHTKQVNNIVNKVIQDISNVVNDDHYNICKLKNICLQFMINFFENTFSVKKKISDEVDKATQTKTKKYKTNDIGALK